MFILVTISKNGSHEEGWSVHAGSDVTGHSPQRKPFMQLC